MTKNPRRSSAAIAAVQALALVVMWLVVGSPATAASDPPGTPFGNFETARAVPGGLELKGWAIDPNTSASIYVWVTVDGVGRHLYANQNRPDVAAAYPGAGPNHGFQATLTLPAGTHTVCVTASNTGQGVHKSLGCRSVSVLAGSPFGNLETVRGGVGAVEVKGWAIDPDTLASVYVWVTIDGVGRHVLADRSRPDVGAAYPVYGSNHGFLATLPTSPGTHTVCVTISNVGAGAHRNLGCRTVTVTAPGTPFGNFEGARGIPGGIEVTGWAIDPDTAASIFVWVTIDGVGRHLFANGNRPDVAAAFPDFGPNHGFSGPLPAAAGTHTVCVTASNVDRGEHRLLGCRVAEALGLPAVWPSGDVIFSTPEAAAEDFVTEVLGVPAQLGEFRQGDPSSGEIDVLFAEGGPPVVRGTLLMRRLGPASGWFVIGATSEGASITSPEALAEVPAGPLTVQGAARGFEGLVVVEAFVFDDGEPVLLDEQVTQGGSLETPEPYSVTLDLSEALPGEVVSLLVRTGTGHSDDPGEFAVIPVVIAE